jgi:hypothetical protein
LTISFFGVNPEDPGDAGNDTGDAEWFEWEGIPPVPAGCAGDPTFAEHPECYGQANNGQVLIGHFAITLNDNFSLTGDTGGWGNGPNPDLFPNNNVTFGSVGDTPEPGAGLLMAAAGIAVIAARKLLGRHQSGTAPR